MVLKVLFLASEVAPFAKTGAGRRHRLVAQGTGRARPRRPRRDAGVRVGGARPWTGRWALRAVPFRCRCRWRQAQLPLAPSKGSCRAARWPCISWPNAACWRGLSSTATTTTRIGSRSSAARRSTRRGRLGWRPDVVHVHDWHAAAAVLWLATAARMTIGTGDHDAAHDSQPCQHRGGPAGTAGATRHRHAPAAGGPYGSINLSRAASTRDKIQHVSPSYAARS